MKRIFLALIVLGLASGMQSCNNGDYKAEPQGNLPTPPSGGNGNGGGGGNGISGGIMSAKVNGSAWSAQTGVILDVAGSVQITGATNANGGSGIQLLVNNNAAVGDYTIDGNIIQGQYTVLPVTSSILGSSGKITIASNEATKITGSFNFSDGTGNVTEGSFSVNK